MKEEIIKLAQKLGFSEPIRIGDYGFISPGEYFIWMCLLQRWLREEHGIDVWVSPILDCTEIKSGVKKYMFDMWEGDEDEDELENDDEDFMFETPELALEAGLQESLKLIKV